MSPAWAVPGVLCPTYVPPPLPVPAAAPLVPEPPATLLPPDPTPAPVPGCPPEPLIPPVAGAPPEPTRPPEALALPLPAVPPGVELPPLPITPPVPTLLPRPVEPPEAGLPFVGVCPLDPLLPPPAGPLWGDEPAEPPVLPGLPGEHAKPAISTAVRSVSQRIVWLGWHPVAPPPFEEVGNQPPTCTSEPCPDGVGDDVVEQSDLLARESLDVEQYKRRSGRFREP